METTHPTPAARLDVTDVLDAAADYIESHGWCQGSLFAYTDIEINDDGEITRLPAACAVGAIYHQLGGSVLHPSAIDLVPNPPLEGNLHYVVGVIADWLALHLLPDVHDVQALVANWNDSAERTADQVIKTLRAAADDYRHTHGGAA